MIPFQNILASLNSHQLEAVETIYGPVLVIAGPGSGKTQLLAARIANILKSTDYLPSNILCLTFTENAAKNMRDRLASMIGQDAYKVAIHTFHSFGSEVIGRFRYLSREFNEAKPVDNIESYRILDEILEELPWDSPYKPGFRASDTIKEVLGNIGNLKKGGITPEYYESILIFNRTAIEEINPLIEEYWGQIDPLGQKKEDKEKKIELFKIFTEKVQQLYNNEKNIGNYERFETVLRRSLDEAWENYEGDTSTKFMNSWRDTWTQKNYKNIRELKETSKFEKQFALAGIFKKYQTILKEKGLIDFSDMILEAITLIETNEVVRLSLAETYQFIMIDEFQDTNEAQMRLINNILSVNTENPNIFAVGDDDQSIYKFQGANTKNIRDFHDLYNDTKLIILEKNYRSKEEIITNSRTVIKSEMNDIGNIFEGAVKKFEAVREDGGLVRKHIFVNELEEISWIVDDIKSKIDAGENPSDIAIITKKNKTLELIGKGLFERGIGANLSKDESLFENEIIILVIQILKFLDSLDGTYRDENAELFVKILSHPCFQINRLTLWNVAKTIYHSRKDTTRSWIETLSAHEDVYIKNTANFLKELSGRARVERLEDIIDYITGANGLSIPDDYDDDGQTNPFQINLFGSEKSDYISPLYTYFFNQISNQNGSNIIYTRHLANVRVFVEHVRSYKTGKNFLTLSDAMKLIELIEKYDLTRDIITPHIIGNEQKDVNLITVYKAKGLEWKHVYVPCVHTREYKSGKISGSNLPKNLPLEADRDNDDDIERLIYTAFTRAKDTLTISYSRENISEKSLEPLSCIEIENNEWEEITTVPLTSLTKTLEVEKQELFALPYIGEEKDFLKDRIDKIFVMNATALQNFLNIVDAGPEKFVANSLLRFPQAKNIAASYGSAIHKALEDFLTDYMNKKSYKKDILFESFEVYLKEEGFDSKTLETYLARGKENLESIYTELTGQTYGELFLEYDFRAAHGGTYLPSGTTEAIQITGKIDRIEKLADDSLIITDYKTGSGFDTFDGKGAEFEKIKQWKYRLQLAFYAILFELSPRWRMYQSKKYELFFVEKNRDEDRFHRVVEYIQTGEIERAKSLIIAVSKCISNMNFPDINKYPKTIDGIRQFEDDLIAGNI
ncbi:ATP-dependent helicase [Candidatus Gracilibacteria bacterium]|nr:ATP-dependent helicase [Candidatus Gracilibacteria bacterium]